MKVPGGLVTKRLDEIGAVPVTEGLAEARTGVSLLAPGLVLTAVTMAALAQGGRNAWAAACLAVLLVAAAAASVVERPWSARELAGLPVLPVVLLGGWSVLRGLLGSHPGAGIGYALLLGGGLLVLVLVRRMSVVQEGWFVDELLLVGSLVAATGWLGVVLRWAPWGHLDGALWRGATAITYENAAAGLLVPLALVALGRCARADLASVRRRSAVVALVLLTGVGATISRGGVLALAVGLVVLVLLLRRATVGLLPPLVGAGIAVASLLPSIPADRPAAPVPAVVGLAAGLAISLASARVAGLAGVLGGLSLVIVATATSQRWLPGAAGRVSPRSTERTEQLHAAIALWRQNPVIGVTPGQGALRWSRPDGLELTATYVHNEYVQVLLELGVVGLVLLCAVGVGLVRLVRRGTRAGTRLSLHAGAVAGLAAFLLHSGLDFLWHVPVVPIVVATLIAVASRREEAP
jgi:O-antigen ligase